MKIKQILNISSVMQHLFPDADPSVDYELFDNGLGEMEIKTDLHLPTQAKLLKISKQLDVEASLANRLSTINAECERLTASVRADVPPDEVQSWGKQETEARALVANPDLADTVEARRAVPLLSAIASARRIPLALLAQKIIEKSDAYAMFTGALIGTRQALEDRLLAIDVTASDAAEQIAAVRWPTSAEPEPEPAPAPKADEVEPKPDEAEV